MVSCILTGTLASHLHEENSYATNALGAQYGRLHAVTYRIGPVVLISSAGRRVELLRAFRHATQTFSASYRSGPSRVLSADRSWYSSAFHDADQSFHVPACTDPKFVPHMLELCTSQRVNLVVPTIDPELPVYAAAREEFAAIGTTIAISSPDVVAIAGDKVMTHNWLVGAGFPTVTQGSVAEVRADPDSWPFPLVVKPRFGSASKGVVKVNDAAGFERTLADWQATSAAADDPYGELVVQSVARGVEYTVDVLVTLEGSRHGSGVIAVPRRRIEIRAGEVSKAMTVRSPLLIELAEKVAAALPGAYGPLNIQLFFDEETSQLAVIEVNARFGGGFPLSFAAGADFPLALVQEALGMPVTALNRDWRDNLVMLRYDAAVFVDGTDAPSGVDR